MLTSLILFIKIKRTVNEAVVSYCENEHLHVTEEEIKDRRREEKVKNRMVTGLKGQRLIGYGGH